ncbi:hypothetical protein [Paraburkholderia youngii]|uniref:Uncharacterized protein n=2 Tax=Paraburkholderia youngii TaxID=2782701 RepID=A0A7Y6K960_9BURK|nr:hypothetical protein [Paraburkholderia youngii]NUY06134.1 hypothetical protein [Paraburkholderia youngii]
MEAPLGIPRVLGVGSFISGVGGMKHWRVPWFGMRTISHASHQLESPTGHRTIFANNRSLSHAHHRRHLRRFTLALQIDLVHMVSRTLDPCRYVSRNRCLQPERLPSAGTMAALSVDHTDTQAKAMYKARSIALLHVFLVGSLFLKPAFGQERLYTNADGSKTDSLE